MFDDESENENQSRSCDSTEICASIISDIVSKLTLSSPDPNEDASNSKYSQAKDDNHPNETSIKSAMESIPRRPVIVPELRIVDTEPSVLVKGVYSMTKSDPRAWCVWPWHESQNGDASIQIYIERTMVPTSPPNVPAREFLKEFEEEYEEWKEEMKKMEQAKESSSNNVET